MKIQDPAFDYDRKEHDYANVRKADPRIGAYVLAGLSACDTILNVGAGTGSYEPEDRYVVSVEPSAVMRAKRLELGKTPALNAKADALPFDDKSFDAALAILTIHHWPDLRKGLEELKRVSRKRMVILSYDPEKLDLFWNAEYFPEVVEVERRRYPPLDTIAEIIGITPRVTPIQIPFDCSDGFQEAFYGRPEGFLVEAVRRSQSAWGFVDRSVEDEYVARLRGDLESGQWDNRYGFHRRMPLFEGAYRMLEFDL